MISSVFGAMRTDHRTMGNTNSLVSQDHKSGPSSLEKVSQTQSLISGQVEALYESVQLQNELIKALSDEKDTLLFQLAEARSQKLKSRVEQGDEPVRTRSTSVCFGQGCLYLTEFEKLKAKMSELQTHSTRADISHEKLKKRLEMENTKLVADNKKLKDDKRTLVYEMKRLADINEKLHREKNDMEEKCRLLEGNALSASHRVLVYFFTGGQKSQIDDVSSELGAMLSCHIESRGLKIRIEQCGDPQNYPVNSPLIVLCVNASRLGTDVHHALQRVKCDPSVAVVIFHHKEFYALPSQSSEKLLVGAQYRQLGAIVDIAFLKSKGMYTCDMNERAIDKLCAFIEKVVRQS